MVYQLTYSDLSTIIENMYCLNEPSSSIANIVDILNDHHEYVEVILKNFKFYKKLRAK